MEDFQIRHPEVETKMKEIGQIIGSVLPEGYGFSLLVFSYGEGGSMFYMSNAERADMLKGMREFLDRPENQDV